MDFGIWLFRETAYLLISEKCVVFFKESANKSQTSVILFDDNYLRKVPKGFYTSFVKKTPQKPNVYFLFFCALES